MEGPMVFSAYETHEVEVEEEPRRHLLFARCSCGLMYPAVTCEQEAREGIIGVMQTIHVEEMRALVAREVEKGKKRWMQE